MLISSEEIPGWAVANEGNVTVALDITLTEALKKEGIARDFVNRIQNLRKDMGLEILDKIAIEVQQSSAETDKAITEFADYIRITDGDGDTGLGQGDTLPPYDVAPWFYNLFLDYEEKQNGVWVRPALLLPLYYRVPVITPSGQDKTLEGELAVALTPWPTIPNTPFDTVRYVVKLVDRALHESNAITTGPIVLP